MTTAGDQINLALKMIGALASGETASAADSQDALTVLNQMLDAWSIESLMVYSTQTQSFTWPANESSRTVGPTGDFSGNRPVKVSPDTYFVDGNNSYTIPMISERQYSEIAQKDATSTYPEYWWVNYTIPDVTITVYPVPTKELTWKVVSDVVLAQPAGLTTTLSFPPGYLMAFSNNLAVLLASFFGINPPPMVLATAQNAKRAIKRQNVKKMTTFIDSRLPGMAVISNIESGI